MQQPQPQPAGGVHPQQRVPPHPHQAMCSPPVVQTQPPDVKHNVPVPTAPISNLMAMANIYLDINYSYSRGIMLWDQTKKLPRELLKQVEDIYQQSAFPMEVRLHLAAWIEEKFSPTIPFVPEDPQHQEMAANLAQQLLNELRTAVDNMPCDPDKFLPKQRLGEVLENLKQSYSANLVGLYILVRHCLEQEMKIVQQDPSASTDIGEQIRKEIDGLKLRVTETNNELERCQHAQEAFSVEYHTFREQGANFELFVQQNGEHHPDVKKYRIKKEQMEKNIKAKYLEVTRMRSTLLNVYIEIFQAVKKVQMTVLDNELIKWKRQQQLAGNGEPASFSLETLQEWCEGLADIIWPMRQQIKKIENLQKKLGDPQPNQDQILMNLMAGITELLSNLVTGTFIIEKQPPQVMKTNTRFTSTVRLLVGGVLNVHMVAPTVSVSIVSEAQANTLLTSPSNEPKKKDDYSSGDILNGNGTMEFHNATKQVSVSFRNLQLKKIKRTEKKGTESVMDEKFSVLFWTEFQVGELKFQLWTLSLPVVVIVHGNQEPQALATVTWDNAFAEWGRKPFVVPDSVSWERAGNALNMKWRAACGGELTQENLYYLACKAFRNNNLSRDPNEYNKLMLTWSLFCKETLPNRNFTFWEWFYRILILTSNHMQRIWKDGFVMGFVDKHHSETLLLQKQQPGYFLVRFSDSVLGGVTIGYTKYDNYQNLTVKMLEPFTMKNLAQKSIGDIIFDLKVFLHFLYPEVPIEVLKKFCTPQGQSNPSTNGYVKHMLVTQVEGQMCPSMESNPQTPVGYESISGSMHGDHGDAQSPMGAYGLDDTMDMQMQEMPNLDIVDSIDVRQILGLTDDMLPSDLGQGFQ